MDRVPPNPDFNPKRIIADAVTRVLAEFAKCERGDTVPWAMIEGISGFTRPIPGFQVPSPHWSAFVRRLKRDLLRHQSVTVYAVTNVGFRIETLKEQLHDRAIRRQRRAVRQMTMDVKELAALPDAELSDHERATKHRKIDMSKVGRRAVLYSLNLNHKLSKPAGGGFPRVRNPPPAADVA